MRVSGTELPARVDDLASLDEVAAALSAVRRLPLDRLYRLGPGRASLLRVAGELGTTAPTEVAAVLGVSVSLASRRSREQDPAADVAARVLRDPRFPGLEAGNLSRRPAWRRYCRVRNIHR